MARRTSGRVDVTVRTNQAGAAARLTSQQLEQLVAASTAAVEAEAKLELQALVYDTPEPNPARPRTGNLMNTTGSEVAGTEGQVFSSADYAAVVHEGVGSGLNAHPRPWLVNALQTESGRVAARARRISRGEMS